MVKAIIYTKVCLPCVYEDGWTLVQSWAGVNDVKIKVRRTTYNPLWHERATKAYGSDKYLAFAKINGKKIKISTMIKNLKEGDDLHKLLGAKRPTRKNRVSSAKKKTTKKAKEKE